MTSLLLLNTKTNSFANSFEDGQSKAVSTSFSPTIYLGTGGFSDTDLLGTLYPKGTKKTDFLALYAQQYSAVEINSSFYSPLGKKAFEGMVRKSEGRIKFAVKLHQDFSHTLKATPEQAISFINALQPLVEAECLGPLLIQFPHGFNRNVKNRLYLAKMVDWFSDYSLAIEFRHSSWHIAQVEHSFQKLGLIWCSVDYPKVKGLPASRLLFTQQSKNLTQSSQPIVQQSNQGLGQNSNQKKQIQKRTGYLRLHGNNLNWWHEMSASERHNYRYTKLEMKALAQAIANQQQYFDELYVFFQNTTNAHAYYNIAMLREELRNMEFKV